MDHLKSQAENRCGAKSANEQQDTPNKKACDTKIKIVIFRTIQHSAMKFLTNQ